MPSKKKTKEIDLADKSKKTLDGIFEPPSQMFDVIKAATSFSNQHRETFGKFHPPTTIASLEAARLGALETARFGEIASLTKDIIGTQSALMVSRHMMDTPLLESELLKNIFPNPAGLLNNRLSSMMAEPLNLNTLISGKFDSPLNYRPSLFESPHTPSFQDVLTVSPLAKAQLQSVLGITSKYPGFTDLLTTGSPALSTSLQDIFKPTTGLLQTMKTVTGDLGKYSAAAQAAIEMMEIPSYTSAALTMLGSVDFPLHNLNRDDSIRLAYTSAAGFSSTNHGRFSLGAAHDFLQLENNRLNDLEWQLNNIERVVLQQGEHEDNNFKLGILISILFFIFQYYSAYQSEQRILERIEQSEQQMASQLELVKQQPSYVVITPLNLRSGPSEKNRIIQTLSPNQPVTYIAMKGRWMKVEIFDYIDNVRVVGWVHSDYIKTVESF